MEQESETSEMNYWTAGGDGELALSPAGRRFTLPWINIDFANSDWRTQWSLWKEQLTFPLLWVFIGLVSAYDVFLVLRYAESIWYLEMNPIGRVLLNLSEGKPTLLIAGKFLGTNIALGLLILVRHFSKRYGELVISAVAGFQLILLAYLLLG